MLTPVLNSTIKADCNVVKYLSKENHNITYYSTQAVAGKHPNSASIASVSTTFTPNMSFGPIPEGEFVIFADVWPQDSSCGWP